MDTFESQGTLKFVRHNQLGPGFVVEQKDQSITAKFCSPEGRIDNKVYHYRMDDWRIKAIPEDSLGAFFASDPERIFALVDQHEPEVIELTLREFGGKAKQADLRVTLNPLLKSRGFEWSKWWKKLAQKLRKRRSVVYHQSDKTYAVVNDSQEGGSSRDFWLELTNISNADQLAQSSREAIARITDLSRVDTEVLRANWEHLLQALRKVPPKGKSAVGLLALGEVLSNTLTAVGSWETQVTEWLGDNLVNLLGIRDSAVREYALRTVSRIEWPKKIDTLSSYLLNEESGEKNRRTATKLLWEACGQDPDKHFAALNEAARVIRIPPRSPLVFLTSRLERILNSSLLLVGSLQGAVEIDSFCGGMVKLIVLLTSRVTNPPLGSALTRSLLGLWLQWIEQFDHVLPPENHWIPWLSCLHLLRSCSESARQRFFEDQEQLVDTLLEDIVRLANSGSCEKAESLYQVLSLTTTSSLVTQRLSRAFQEGGFLNEKAQEWVLSHTVHGQTLSPRFNGKKESVENRLIEFAFQPRERRLVNDIARLILLTREKKAIFSDAVNSFEELARLYDPVGLQSAQNLRIIYGLIHDGLESLRLMLGLDFVGVIGNIDAYNPNLHQVVGPTIAAPKYVEILTLGMVRKQKDALPEVIQKAIVKPATGDPR